MVSVGSGPPAHSASLEPAAYRMDRALTTEHPPVAGALRDLPPAPQPSGEARRRSERRFHTSPWSHPAPRRFCDGSSRLGHGSVTALSRLVTARHGFVTPPCLQTPNSADKRDKGKQMPSPSPQYGGRSERGPRSDRHLDAPVDTLPLRLYRWSTANQKGSRPITDR